MKIRGNTVSTTMKRPDFNQTDPKKSDYILNNPIPRLTEQDEGKTVVVKNGKYELGTVMSDGTVASGEDFVPRMKHLDEMHGNYAVENYGGEGVSFAESRNRVYVEMSDGRGISTRYCLSAGPNAPRDPDPEDFANGKNLDSIPLRMDDGFVRVPVSEYGKTQPEVGDDNYSEEQRAMSKKYIDTGIDSRVKKASNSSDLNQLYGELSKSRGQTMFAVCNGPTATSDHIPQRTKDGLMRCNTPEDGADNLCANKGYVGTKAEESKSYAEKLFNGANKAVSYDNYSTMITTLNSLSSDVYKVGQNIMIVTLGVPDLWVSAVSTDSSVYYNYVDDVSFAAALKSKGTVQVGYYTLSALETQKVDLSKYPTTEMLENGNVKPFFAYFANRATYAEGDIKNTIHSRLQKCLQIVSFDAETGTLVTKSEDYVEPETGSGE